MDDDADDTCVYCGAPAEVCLICPKCARDGCPECMPAGCGCACPECEEEEEEPEHG